LRGKCYTPYPTGVCAEPCGGAERGAARGGAGRDAGGRKDGGAGVLYSLTHCCEMQRSAWNPKTNSHGNKPLEKASRSLRF